MVYNTKKKKNPKNKNKKKGTNFEYRVKYHFEDLGYYVRRNYKSQGAEDLNAIKKIEVWDDDGKGCTICSEVLHIQCKNRLIERGLTKKEADRLKALAKQTGGTPLLAKNVNHKLIIEEVE